MDSTFCVRSPHVSKGSTLAAQNFAHERSRKDTKKILPAKHPKDRQNEILLPSFAASRLCGKIFFATDCTAKIIPFIPVDRPLSFIPHSAFVSSCPTLSHACPTADWDGETIDTIDVTVIFCRVPRISKTFRATDVNER